MENYLEDLLTQALAERGVAEPSSVIEFQTPANPEHGDLATNVALRLAKSLGTSPRELATELAAGLDVDDSKVASVEVAGPGFLNFRFAKNWLHDQLARIIESDTAYGRTDTYAGKRALVEFVSANPTGPLTVGHGRNAVLGDTVANLLEWTGHDVTREYYFNDAGRQMRLLVDSVRAWVRYLNHDEDPSMGRTVEIGGKTKVVPKDLPEDGYMGDYIAEVAKNWVEGDLQEPWSKWVEDHFPVFVREQLFLNIEKTLGRIKVFFSPDKNGQYFKESDLREDADKTLDDLRNLDLVYEKDGATWLKTTTFGKEQDTVLVKSSGEPTYRLPDIAYHRTKLDRGYDLAVDVFGADHVGTYPDILNALDALGYDTSKIDVVIYQFVTLVRDGAPVKMSTRKATYVTLDELIDEVGADVTRFFFLMRAPGTHLDFDIGLAKEAREKNPVFYLQYAHARICSIMRKSEEVGFEFETVPSLTLLTHPAELALIKALLDFPAIVSRAAESREPHRLINYLNDVATTFTGFYDKCHIIGEEEELATARMALANATRIVLRNGLAILGITAPEVM